jgi:hypothetical protein
MNKHFILALALLGGLSACDGSRPSNESCQTALSKVHGSYICRDEAQAGTVGAAIAAVEPPAKGALIADLLPPFPL